MYPNPLRAGPWVNRRPNPAPKSARPERKRFHDVSAGPYPAARVPMKCEYWFRRVAALDGGRLRPAAITRSSRRPSGYRAELMTGKIAGGDVDTRGPGPYVPATSPPGRSVGGAFDLTIGCDHEGAKLAQVSETAGKGLPRGAPPRPPVRDQQAQPAVQGPPRVNAAAHSADRGRARRARFCFLGRRNLSRLVAS